MSQGSWLVLGEAGASGNCHESLQSMPELPAASGCDKTEVTIKHPGECLKSLLSRELLSLEQ